MKRDLVPFVSRNDSGWPRRGDGEANDIELETLFDFFPIAILGLSHIVSPAFLVIYFLSSVKRSISMNYELQRQCYGFQNTLFRSDPESIGRNYRCSGKRQKASRRTDDVFA
jgi:hypothetical protein